MSKLFESSYIPESLWDRKRNKIILPASLRYSWIERITKIGLLEKAKEPVPEGIAGGISKEDTDKHLAWKFSGSAARTQLSFLDPYEKLGNISDAYMKIFSGETVLIADLPSGSGAAIATLLSTVEQLRREEVIPRIPLTVKIVAGEISDFAREHAADIINNMRKELEKQAIYIEAEYLKWNALSKISTADITRKLIIQSQQCCARLILMANFSDFLQKNKKWNEACKNFEDLFVHARDNESYVIWIEPSTNEVTDKGGFMPNIVKWFRTLFKRGDEDEEFFSCDSLGQHPLRENIEFHVNLTIKRFDLPNH